MTNPSIKSIIEAVNGQQWLDTLRQQTDIDNSSVSTEGVFFDADKQSLFEGEHHRESYGGFFTEIEPENRDEAIEQLFQGEGQWLIDYLNTGNRPHTMFNRDPQKEAFIDAYDRLMTAFLDARRLGEDDFNLWSFVNYAGDQTLTDKELFELIDKHNFTDSLSQMGPELSGKWIQFSGGVLQGLLDYESDRLALNGTLQLDRYDAGEFERLISPFAQQVIEGNIRETHYPALFRSEGLNALEIAVEAMESNCATRLDRVFTAPIDQRASMER